MSDRVINIDALEKRPHSTDICFFTTSISGGGAERIIVYLAGHFAAKGLNVDVVVCKSSAKETLENLLPDNVRLISLNARRTLLCLPAYLKYLRTARPKVVLSTIIRANILAGLAKICMAPKHQLIIRGEISLQMWKDPGKIIQSKWFLIPLTVLSYPFADKFIGVSKGVCAEFIKLPFVKKDKVHCIYNPTINDNFTKRMDEAITLPDLVDANLPIILAAARLAPEKDYPTMFRAFKKVREHTDCQLVIVGDGHIRDELKALTKTMGIDERTHFIGFVPNAVAYMKRADVFVLSSLAEGLPNALIEALATGTQVVSTDCPHGPKEILESGRFGGFVSIGDDDAMAKSIIEALKNANAPMSQDLKEHMKQFHIDFVSPRYEEIVWGDH